MKLSSRIGKLESRFPKLPPLRICSECAEPFEIWEAAPRPVPTVEFTEEMLDVANSLEQKYAAVLAAYPMEICCDRCRMLSSQWDEEADELARTMARLIQNATDARDVHL